MDRLDCQAKILEDILVKLTENELSVKQSDSKFEACAKGFRMTKEACEVLLEKLDSACGTITEQSWNTTGF